MNTRLWVRIGLLAFVLAAAALLLAWQTEGAGAGPATVATASPTASPTPVPVPMAVTMKEFTVSINPSGVATGVVELNVTNQGVLEHELVIMQTDKAPDALTYDAVADRVVESAPGQEDVGEVEHVAAGATASDTFDLAPGHYALICNYAGHYKAGMYTAFTVGAVATASPTPAPTASPTPAPTPTASPAPTAAPTASPAPTAAALPKAGGEPGGNGRLIWVWLIVGLGLIGAASLAWRWPAR